MSIRTVFGTSRRIGGLGAMLVIGLLVAGQVPAIEQPTLQDRLEKGLRARTPAESAFLARVVESVEDRELPEKLVNRVFFWARKKADDRGGSKQRRPMVYFQPAITKLAARIGVNLE